MRSLRESWRRVLLVVVLLAAAGGAGLLVGACDAGRAAREAPRPEATAPPPLGSTARFPLDDYLLRPAQANDLDTVIKQLTRDCMLRHGQRWEPGGRNDFDLLRHRAQRFGLADESLAAASGYHWDPTAPQRPLSPAQRRLLHGDAGATGGPGAADGVAGGAGGGCAGEAGRTVGWAAGEFEWLRGLGEEALRTAWNDPRAARVVAGWSSCMAEAGFRYGHPREAETDALWWRDDAGQASAEEKRTAVADVRCRVRVRLAQELSGILVEEQERVVHDNRERLEAFRRMADSAAERADGIRGDRRTPGPGGSSATPVPPGGWRAEHTSA